MVVPHNENLQENGTNRELRLRGRRDYAQILIWRSRSGACKEKKLKRRGVSLSWVEEKLQEMSLES